METPRKKHKILENQKKYNIDMILQAIKITWNNLNANHWKWVLYPNQ